MQADYNWALETQVSTLAVFYNVPYSEEQSDAVFLRTAIRVRGIT